MATCSIQDLLSANPCLASLSPYQVELVITQQLCGLLNFLESSEPLTCDIQTLLDDAQCFASLPLHELKILQSQLLCEIFALL